MTIIRALLSQKTLTIASGTKIFGYASDSATSLTDYTTSTNLTKTGEEWIEFIESITGWQSDSYLTSATEYTEFSPDSFTPNKFKVYNQSLATLLGFVKDQLYSKVGDKIISTYWGSFKLVLSGSVYSNRTSVLEICEVKPARKTDSVILTGFGSVTDYIKGYDNFSYTLRSRINHLSNEINLKTFLNANITNNIGETVLPLNIPKLSITSKTKKFGMLESHFVDDDFKIPNFCKFSCIVVEV